MTRRTVRAAAAALAAAAVLGGCARAHVEAPVAVQQIGSMPARVLGYTIKPEDVTGQLRNVGHRAYVTGVKLWTLREGNYLRAALEVARFAPDAPVAAASFRATVATQVATTEPLLRRVGGDDVYVTTGSRQIYYLWFRGRDLLLLTVPVTTPGPRALLRELLRTARP